LNALGSWGGQGGEHRRDPLETSHGHAGKAHDSFKFLKPSLSPFAFGDPCTKQCSCFYFRVDNVQYRAEWTPPPSPQRSGAVWAEPNTKALWAIYQRGGSQGRRRDTLLFFCKLGFPGGSAKGFWLKGLALPLHRHPPPRHLAALSSQRRGKERRGDPPRPAGPYRGALPVVWLCSTPPSSGRCLQLPHGRSPRPAADGRLGAASGPPSPAPALPPPLEFECFRTSQS